MKLLESFLGFGEKKAAREEQYYPEKERVEMKSFTPEQIQELTDLGFKEEEGQVFRKDTKTGYIKVEKEVVIEGRYSEVYYSVMSKHDKMMQAILDNPQLFKDATSTALGAMTNTNFDQYDDFDSLIKAISNR